jgi:hypothetical protein
VIHLIHISTSSRDDTVHAQRTRGNHADGETPAGIWCPHTAWPSPLAAARVTLPGRIRCSRSSSEHRSCSLLGRGHSAGRGLIPGNRQRPGKARLARHRSADGEIRLRYEMCPRPCGTWCTIAFPWLVVCKATAPPVSGRLGRARCRWPSPLNDLLSESAGMRSPRRSAAGGKGQPDQEPAG